MGRRQKLDKSKEDSGERERATLRTDVRPLDVEPDSRLGTSGIRARKRGIRVEEVMSAEPAMVAPSASLTEAARFMGDENLGFLPVTESDGTVVGVLTDRDIVVRGIGKGLSPDGTRVEDVMTEEVVSCKSADDIRVAGALLRANQISRLVVLGDDERLAGVVSLSDLAQVGDEREVGRLLADVTEREAEPH